MKGAASNLTGSPLQKLSSRSPGSGLGRAGSALPFPLLEASFPYQINPARNESIANVPLPSRRLLRVRQLRRGFGSHLVGATMVSLLLPPFLLSISSSLAACACNGPYKTTRVSPLNLPFSRGRLIGGRGELRSVVPLFLLWLGGRWVAD
jgi:hypothetical protein